MARSYGTKGCAMRDPRGNPFMNPRSCQYRKLAQKKLAASEPAGMTPSRVNNRTVRKEKTQSKKTCPEKYFGRSEKPGGTPARMRKPAAAWVSIMSMLRIFRRRKDGIGLSRFTGNSAGNGIPKAARFSEN